MSIYEIKVEKSSGESVALSAYKGKVLLIVNTASKCGLTPQFTGLEKLYQKYREEGLVILGFPCNQFMEQDPESNDNIISFCQLNYGVSFPMFAKIDVNGEHEAPLFSHLKNAQKGLGGRAIKWNFTKFLVDREGRVQKRYAPTTKPEALEKEIVQLLRG